MQMLPAQFITTTTPVVMKWQFVEIQWIIYNHAATLTMWCVGEMGLHVSNLVEPCGY